mmetsp:Transcript_28569/g.84571  ORF Transcript_28569/g.84571 Transcript_28569/m.84571 type:complete len:230 (-) Transcript_28569:769-1458(-)
MPAYAAVARAGSLGLAVASPTTILPVSASPLLGGSMLSPRSWCPIHAASLLVSRRKVVIALGVVREPGAGVGRSELLAGGPAVREVGVLNVRTAERDRVAGATCQHFLGLLASVPAVRNDVPAVFLAYALDRVHLTFLVEAKRQARHDLHVCQVQLAELGEHVVVHLDVVGRAHVVEDAVGAELDAHRCAGVDLKHRLQDLAQQAVAVLDAAAVLVGTRVGLALQEAVE